MKIEITNDPPPKPEPELTYPVLMESVKGEHTITLFTSPQEGFAMKHSGKPHLCRSWVSAANQSQWKPFLGTITLSND